MTMPKIWNFPVELSLDDEQFISLQEQDPKIQRNKR